MKALSIIILLFILSIFVAQAQTIFYILAVSNSQIPTVRTWIDNKTNWDIAGSGAANLAQPFYLLTDTNQTTIRGYYTCVTRSQTTASVRQQINQWVLANPSSVALWTFTNQVTNLDDLMAARGIARKKSQLDTQ